MKKIIYIFYLIISILAISACEDEPLYSETFDQDEIVTTDDNINDNTTETGNLNGWDAFLVIVSTLAIAGIILAFFIIFVPIKLWFQAVLSDVRPGWWQLIMMKMRGVPQNKIINLMIRARNSNYIPALKGKNAPKIFTSDWFDRYKKHHELARLLTNYYLAKVDVDVVIDTLIRAISAKQKIELNDLAQKYLSKIDIAAVVHAMIMAKNAKIKEDISIDELSGYYLSGVNVIDLVKAKIIADNSGLDKTITFEELKSHYLAGGNLEKTIEAYIAAKKAGLPDFEFSDIAAIDLSNIDVLEAIKTAISPHVVETDGVRGVARDGVEITMKVKVTLRSHIKNIIGGVSDETILARVNEGLATEIGLAENHYDILQNPYAVADKVENRNLNTSSAYEILSVDVSDIKVGEDVGAALKSVRAKASAEEAKADLIIAQEKVQKAMAAAFFDGKITVETYNKIKNMEADTEMRKSFSNIESNPDGEE